MLATVGAVIAIIISLVGLLVQIIAVGIYIGKLEGFKTLVDFRFQALEKKQDKHNNLIERMVRVEDSAKSAHKRINEINGEDNHEKFKF